MHSIRRSCQSALAANWTCSALAGSSRRAFSQSRTWQRGTLPQYLESSSPELGALLAKLNAKKLLPEHLTKDQAKLVFKKENQPRLEAETIEITLGGVTLPLEHIDRMKDVPSTWKTLKEIIEKSKTPEDWENVLRALEGMRNAGIFLRRRQLEKTVRSLFQANMPHLVLKALQRADKTGLRLRHPDLVSTIMWGLHTGAAKQAWDEHETARMLRFAEQIVELMENEEHLGKMDPAAKDLRASPFVIAVPLELAAARAKRHTDGKDTDGKVKTYALRLMGALLQDETNIGGLLTEQLQAVKAVRGGKQAFPAKQALCNTLREVIPLWDALKTAHQVLGADMPSADVARRVEEDLNNALEGAEKMLAKEEGRDGPEPMFLTFVKSISTCRNI